MSANSHENWKCSGCGCTETEPCPGGCGWVAPNYCSACLAKAPPLSDEERKVAHLVLRGTKVRLHLNGAAAMDLWCVLQWVLHDGALPAKMEERMRPTFSMLVTQLSVNAECARMCAESPREDQPAPEPEQKLIVSPAEAAAEMNELPPGGLLLP